MIVDVCILAGGCVGRGAGCGEGLKVLLRFCAKPLLFHLLEMVRELNPRVIRLALGFNSVKVLELLAAQSWWRAGSKENSLDGLYGASIEPPEGTAVALRKCVAEWNLKAPLLVLNGDTLPYYWLSDLLRFHDRCGNVDATVAWYDDRLAGAAVVNALFLSRLAVSEETDLDRLLFGASRYHVSGGFHDVGTPEGFQRATHLKEYP